MRRDWLGVLAAAVLAGGCLLVFPAQADWHGRDGWHGGWHGGWHHDGGEWRGGGWGCCWRGGVFVGVVPQYYFPPPYPVAPPDYVPPPAYSVPPADYGPPPGYAPYGYSYPQY